MENAEKAGLAKRWTELLPSRGHTLPACSHRLCRPRRSASPPAFHHNTHDRTNQTTCPTTGTSTHTPVVSTTLSGTSARASDPATAAALPPGQQPTRHSPTA